jgi:hypothetical protein
MTRYITRLEQAFAELSEEPQQETCAGMKGLISEGDYASHRRQHGAGERSLEPKKTDWRSSLRQEAEQTCDVAPDF